MGITLQLKQISSSTLEILEHDPTLIELFYAAQRLPESVFWQREASGDLSYEEQAKQEAEDQFSSSPHRDRFVAEWGIPELDLDKAHSEITYLLAGFIPDPSAADVALPELQSRPELMQANTFMQFSIIENSAWDGLPLVNALWAGTQLGQNGTEWYQSPEAISQILDGLQLISEEGLQARYQRESEAEEPCLWIDWEDEETLDWLTEDYHNIVDYYRDASDRGNSILVCLSI